MNAQKLRGALHNQQSALQRANRGLGTLLPNQAALLSLALLACTPRRRREITKYVVLQMRWCLAAVVAVVPHAMALAARRKKPRRPPRLALGALTERTTFVATLVERSDLRRRAHAPPERAICLADVTTNGAVVADHCWLRGADARAIRRNADRRLRHVRRRRRDLAAGGAGGTARARARRALSPARPTTVTRAPVEPESKPRHRAEPPRRRVEAPSGPHVSSRPPPQIRPPPPRAAARSRSSP